MGVQMSSVTSLIAQSVVLWGVSSCFFGFEWQQVRPFSQGGFQSGDRIQVLDEEYGWREGVVEEPNPILVRWTEKVTPAITTEENRRAAPAEDPEWVQLEEWDRQNLFEIFPGSRCLYRVKLVSLENFDYPTREMPYIVLSRGSDAQ